MPVLHDYAQFGHVHWQTGTLASVLAYHMDDPISEALLFGTSGGIVAGYQVTEDKMPCLNLLTSNPFQPLDTIVERLKLPIDDRRTSKPERASRYLYEALDEGQPVIVWLDISALPYTPHAMQPNIQPVVVYGYEEDTVYVADRARVPLQVTRTVFEKARGRAASEQYRQMTVCTPHPSRLALAARLGIESCLRDFLEEPPMKELRGKFGLAAFEYWAHLLETSSETGWRNRYPRGRKLLSMLMSAYHSVHFNGTGGNASRALFADFLEQAADVLDKPTLYDMAELWRESLNSWKALGDALLPAQVEDFAHLRELMQRDHQLFLENGMECADERQGIQQEIDDLATSIGRKFPLTKRQTESMLDNLRDAVLAIHAAESAAVHELRDVMLAVGV